MSAWWIGALVGASLGLARVARRPAHAGGVSADPADWRAAAWRSLGLLRLWLVLGALCFTGAFALMQALGTAQVEVREAIRVLGVTPVVGLLSATSLALLRVGDARRRTEDLLHAAVGWALVGVGGTLAGLVSGVILRAVLATI